MTQTLAPPRRARRWPWTRLVEARFTNIDIVFALGAALMTLFIGALTGAWLLS